MTAWLPEGAARLACAGDANAAYDAYKNLRGAARVQTACPYNRSYGIQGIPKLPGRADSE
jgi:hypothetical protein